MVPISIPFNSVNGKEPAAPILSDSCHHHLFSILPFEHSTIWPLPWWIVRLRSCPFMFCHMRTLYWKLYLLVYLYLSNISGEVRVRIPHFPRGSECLSSVMKLSVLLLVFSVSFPRNHMSLCLEVCFWIFSSIGLFLCPLTIPACNNYYNFLIDFDIPRHFSFSIFGYSWCFPLCFHNINFDQKKKKIDHLDVFLY